MQTKISIVGVTSFCTYLCTYFLNLSMDNMEQYLAIVAVLWLDGIFGIWAGVKREGFKTYKALKITRNTFVWLAILTVILMIEKGFAGTGWLSEIIVVPFMILQLVSALKNASMAGLIKMEELNKILDRIDKHKGFRK
jgi:phage-related holin|tara:strand:- start:19 stop:432 length:414 start_codon:yes stop_codon:yes gene_type:complete